MSKAMPLSAILVAGTLALAGCTAGASNRPPGAPTDPPPASPSPSIFAEPSVAAETAALAPEPPLAELVIGGDRYPGEVGGYTWDGYSQSAPWLPATGLSPVEVSANAALSVELAGGEAVISWWAAQVADAADPAVATARPLGSGETTVDIVGPGSGTWVMEVRVTYADARGDAAYYWQLVVP